MEAYPSLLQVSISIEPEENCREMKAYFDLYVALDRDNFVRCVESLELPTAQEEKNRVCFV